MSSLTSSEEPVSIAQLADNDGNDNIDESLSTTTTAEMSEGDSTTITQPIDNQSSTADPSTTATDTTQTQTTTATSSTQQYNQNIKLCPGYEELKIHGYTTLVDLQTDLINYYNFLSSDDNANDGSVLSDVSSNNNTELEGVNNNNATESTNNNNTTLNEIINGTTLLDDDEGMNNNSSSLLVTNSTLTNTTTLIADENDTLNNNTTMSDNALNNNNNITNTTETLPTIVMYDTEGNKQYYDANGNQITPPPDDNGGDEGDEGMTGGDESGLVTPPDDLNNNEVFNNSTSFDISDINNTSGDTLNSTLDETLDTLPTTNDQSLNSSGGDDGDSTMGSSGGSTLDSLMGTTSQDIDNKDGDGLTNDVNNSAPADTIVVAQDGDVDETADMSNEEEGGDEVVDVSVLEAVGDEMNMEGEDMSNSMEDEGGSSVATAGDNMMEENTLDMYTNNRRRNRKLLRTASHTNNDGGISRRPNINIKDIGNRQLRSLQDMSSTTTSEGGGSGGEGMEANSSDSTTITEENGLVDEIGTTMTTSLAADSKDMGTDEVVKEDDGLTTVKEGTVVIADDGGDSNVDEEGPSIFPEAPDDISGGEEAPYDINGEGMNSTDSTAIVSEEDTITDETSSATATAEQTRPTVSFPICPNSNLKFTSNAVGVAINAEPLILQTPSRFNPIDIYCITDTISITESSGIDISGIEEQQQTRSCTMSGGDVHILIEHSGHGNSDNDVNSNIKANGQEGISNHYPISISGITFENASTSSIHMLDPRGPITFTDCGWQNNNNNKAAAIDDDENVGTIVIDGRYTGFDWTPTPPTLSSSSSSEGADDSSAGTEEGVSTTNTDGGEGVEGRRVLQSEAEFMPRAMISIEDSSFNGNTGASSIKIASYSQGLPPPASDTKQDGSSIYFTIKDTMFINEQAKTSIINNDGGQLQVEGTSFIGNNATSMISSTTNGTLHMTDTSFNQNDLQGTDGGVVVLEEGSVLKMNTGNCGQSNNAPVAPLDSLVEAGDDTNTTMSQDVDIVPSTNTTQDDVTTAESSTAAADTTITTRRSLNVLSRVDMNSLEQSCDGISSSGVCNAFVSCDPDTVVVIDIPKEEAPPCYSEWEGLIAGVRDRVVTNTRDFIICPGSLLVLDDTSSPVILDSDYITVQCGTSDEPANDCIISGGYSQFNILGSPSGVELARLTMSGSTGSSIMAFGTSDATLSLRDCEWTNNKGASAILVHDNDALPILRENFVGPLDIKPLLESSVKGSGMAIEVHDSRFADNEFEFGAISNVGGTLSVYSSRFTKNSGKGGDIVVTNSGSCNVQSSCFSESSSILPGIIFIQDGSTMGGKMNYGADSNTAGGATADTSCTYVFKEAAGSDCLSPLDNGMDCTGSCMAFTTSSCPLDSDFVGMEPVAAPKDEIPVPASTRSEGSGGSSKMVPIIVASLVGAFIVFGFIGIVMRRRKKKPDVVANSSSGGGRRCSCFPCKRGGKNNTTVDEDVEFSPNDYD